jgi:3-hydroxyacyl-CoA dehydrogenase
LINPSIEFCESRRILQKSFSGMFAYVSNRIPEISDELYKIDDAMKAGFGWKMDHSEIWDAIGVEKELKS